MQFLVHSYRNSPLSSIIAASLTAFQIANFAVSTEIGGQYIYTQFYQASIQYRGKQIANK